MLVIDLINQLKNLDPQAEVYFAHPSHDFWRTELASPVSAVEKELVKFNDYHSQMSPFDLDEDADDDDKIGELGEQLEGTLAVVMLRS